MEDERQDQPQNQSGEQQPPPPQQTAVTAPTPEGPEPRTSGLAIASLALAILGFITCVGGVIFGPIAIILGIIAMVQIGRNPRRLKGWGLALSGTIISAVSFFLIVPIMAAILFPVFARARDAALKATCLSNVKQIGIAMKMYCSDYDDLYPPTRKWNDAIKPYVKDPKILICPKAGGVEPTYAMNDFLGGLSDVEIMSPAETVMVFESIPGINLAGGLELFQEPPRHKDAVNIGFADGHAESISPEYTDSLIWDPYSAVSGFDESDSEYY